jgi:hypothetical protein
MRQPQSAFAAKACAKQKSLLHLISAPTNTLKIPSRNFISPHKKIGAFPVFFSQ